MNDTILILYHINKRLMKFFALNSSFSMGVVFLIFFSLIFSACIGNSLEPIIIKPKVGDTLSSGRLSHLVFNKLNSKWISSSYFDRGMKYKNSRFKVVSFVSLLDKHSNDMVFDAILLKCADDYQGLVTLGDIRHYDLQLAIKIKLIHGSETPAWLKPLLIIVPDDENPPFSERFLTANIKEIQFIRLAEYFEPLDRKILIKPSSKAGKIVFKDNCLFCHSINGVGGNKGGSLLDKFNFQLVPELRRFKKAFFLIHGQDNSKKQNTKQFLVEKDLGFISKFLAEIKD